MTRQAGDGHTVTSLFQKADLFTGPIYLNIRGRPTMATTLGGILSLALVIILLTQGALQAAEMFNHTNPNVLQMTEFYDDPEAIYLNSSNNFMFAVSTTVDGTFIDMTQNSLFQFNASFNQYYRNKTTGKRPKYYAQIPMAPCNESDFGFLPNNTFVTYNLSMAYCPKYINYTFWNGTCPDFITTPDCTTPLDFKIRGTYLSADFEFIQFNVSICNEADPQRPWKIQCESPDKINDYFQNSQIKWNLYYTNTLLNPVRYDPANKTFFDSIYWDMVKDTWKVSDIYIDETTIVTHDSYYSSAARPNETFYNIDPSKNREQGTFNNGKFPTLQWNLRRSNFNMVTSRTYTKIQDILANIGGFSKSIMFVMAIIAAGYVKYKYQMMLSNELYNYDIPKNGSRSANNSRSSNRDDLDEDGHPKRKSRNASLSMQQNLLNHDTQGDVATGNQYSGQSDEDKIKKFFSEEKQTTRKIGYNELTYFFSNFFYCCRRKSYDERLAAKARMYVEKDIDIINLVRKVQELDKLKMVLLTSDQRQLFNYVPKPMVTESSDTPLERDASLIHHNEPIEPYVDDGEAGREDHERVVKFTNLYTSYKRVSRDIDVSRATSNRRLLALIGEDLIKVFQKVDKEVGEDPDPRHLQNVLWRYIQNEKKNQ